MKRILLAFAVLLLAPALFAALPFTDNFEASGPSTDWAEWFNTGGTLTCVTSDVDHRSVTVNPPSGSDGYFGKSTFVAPTYATHGWIAGEATDKDYNVECKIFVPQVTGTAEPDDYLYQMLIFYVKPDIGQYCRFHSQYNLDVAMNRVRIQIVNGSFVKTVAVTDTFSGGDGWHTFRAELSGATGNFYLDGTLMTGAPITWTTEGPTVLEGQFGFGQFIDGAGTRSVYVDAFSATDPSRISDWSQFE